MRKTPAWTPEPSNRGPCPACSGTAAGAGDRKGDALDWKTIGNYALLVGLFATTITMFNQVYSRLDIMQAESNRRFDTMQAEMDRRFEAMRAEMNALRTEMNRRFDTVHVEMNRRFDTLQAENQRQHDDMEAENQRQHDTMEEVLRLFEGRITRLEEKAGVDAGGAE